MNTESGYEKPALDLSSASGELARLLHVSCSFLPSAAWGGGVEVNELHRETDLCGRLWQGVAWLPSPCDGHDQAFQHDHLTDLTYKSGCSWASE